MLPLRVRVDLGAMAMKGCAAFPKAPALLEPYHQIFCLISKTLLRRVSYPSAEMQSVYSIAPENFEGIEMKTDDLIEAKNQT